jgi:hypothetical protein
MRRIVKNLLSFIIALIGFLGGIVWMLLGSGGIEALILVLVSFCEVVAYFIVKEAPILTTVSAIPINNENIVNVNIHGAEYSANKDERQIDREFIINAMKSKVRILFIDDDGNFNVVKILKDSGWRLTKTQTDIRSLDLPIVIDAHILFIDINGVGKMLALQYEGLDLALMLKQRYPSKKVIIYSANKLSNSFHQAWDKCDYKLEKNALPYQFQSLVEEFSIDIYQSRQ